MKAKPRRKSKVSRAILYLRGFELGRVSVNDPERLRRACKTVLEYIAKFENDALETEKRSRSDEIQTS